MKKERLCALYTSAESFSFPARLVIAKSSDEKNNDNDPPNTATVEAESESHSYSLLSLGDDSSCRLATVSALLSPYDKPFPSVWMPVYRFSQFKKIGCLPP